MVSLRVQSGHAADADMNRKISRILAPALSAAVIALITAAVHLDPDPIRSLRNLTFDSFQRWSPRVALDVPVRIIDIDDASLERTGQWPWPRTVLARLVEQLQAMGAAVITFDMVFPEPDRTSPAQALELWKTDEDVAAELRRLPDHDRVFADAIANAPVVLGAPFLDKDGKSPRLPPKKAGISFAGDDPRQSLPHFGSVTANLEAFQEGAAGIGSFNFVSDSDGIVRRIPLFIVLGNEIYPSIVAESLRVARTAGTHVIKSTGASAELDTGALPAIASVKIADVVIPTDADGTMRLYMAPLSSSRYLSAADVLEGMAPRELVEGHIVLIGTSAAGLLDLRFSPLGEPVAGVEFHAQALEQAISSYLVDQQPELRSLAGQQLLVRPDWAKGAETVTMLALSLLLILLMLRVSALTAAFCGLATIGTAIAGALWAFRTQGLLFDPVLPALGFLMTYLSFSVFRHIQAEHERRWIKTAFASYISPAIVEQLVRNPDQLKLGGERRDMTFLFTDLAGLTPLVEKNPPEKLIPLLNDYIDGLTKIGFAHAGTLDKIVGDATTFYWNAPADQPDHRQRAHDCALAIDAFAERFRGEKSAEGLPLGITRIGVHSGSVIVGNMGGEAIFDYSAHGDAVNTAARLESVNKQLGTRICMSATVTEHADNFTGRPVGDLVLKGRSEPERCLEPLTSAEMSSERTASYLAAYAALEQEAPEALSLFEAHIRKWPEDGPARFHLARLRAGETGCIVVLTEK
jgi:adenylate cyclase